MNKESVSYVRHIMGSDFVQLDFVNVLISIAIIVISFIAILSGNVLFFGISFILGDVLVLFNMIKSIMKKTILGTVVFATMVLALGIVVLYIFRFLV